MVKESKKALSKERTRKKILKHSLALFSLHGYQGATIRMLAKKAGISLGLTYNYFRSKEELLRQLVDDGIKVKLEQIKANYVAQQGLDSLVDAVFASFQSDPIFWRLLQSIKMQPDVLKLVSEEYQPYHDWLNSEVKKALRLQKNQQDPSLVLATIDGVADHYLMDTENYSLQKVLLELKKAFGPDSGKRSSKNRKAKKEDQNDDASQPSLF